MAGSVFNSSLLGNITGYQALLNQYQGFFNNTVIDTGNFVDIYVSDKAFLTAPNQQIVFGSSPNTLTLNAPAQSVNNLLTIPNIGTTIPNAYIIMSDYNNNASGSFQNINSGIKINGTMNFPNLTPSLPLQLDSGGNVISLDIDVNDLSGILAIAKGGTNSGTALMNGNLMVSSGGAIVEGTSSSQPTFSSGTVIFNQTSLSTASTVNNTWIIPTLAASGSDTLVGNTFPATLFNKTLIDNSTIVVNNADTTKQLIFDLSGNTTGTILTIGLQQTTNQTLNIPNISTTDTLVVQNLSQTLSNKTLLDTSTVIANTSDTTKELVFNLSGSSTSTTLSIDTQQLASAILKIPNISSSDTILCQFETAIVHNKSFICNTNYFIDPTDISKKIQFSASGNSSGITLSLAATQTANQTLSIPNITQSDTIIAQILPQLLYNKTLLDTTTAIANTLDQTKKITFNTTLNTSGAQLNLQTAQSTTQYLNFPNITSSDTLATLSLGQTFSGNNTFSGSNTFSSTNTFSSSNTFSSANTFNGVPTFNAGVLFQTSGGTATNLNYYEVVTTTLSLGNFTTTITTTATLTRIGNLKRLDFQAVSGTFASSAGPIIITFPASLSRYYPTNTCYYPVTGQDSGSFYHLNFKFSSAGAINIYVMKPSQSNFTANGSPTGLFTCGFTYL